jgi:hypothetical protein
MGGLGYEGQGSSSCPLMNTQEELRIAFDEYHKGTFIKHKKTIRG